MFGLPGRANGTTEAEEEAGLVTDRRLGARRAAWFIEDVANATTNPRLPPILPHNISIATEASPPETGNR
jgi:hypothetical protein